MSVHVPPLSLGGESFKVAWKLELKLISCRSYSEESIHCCPAQEQHHNLFRRLRMMVGLAPKAEPMNMVRAYLQLIA